MDTYVKKNERNEMLDLDDLERVHECFDVMCYSIRSNKIVSMTPNTIYEVSIRLIDDPLNNYVLQVKHHLWVKPWRILVNYIYPDPITQVMKIPIISNVSCYLDVGDILCHVKKIPMTEIFHRLEGNFI
jgi:hypothetical protein